jgi:hypothetical protein
MCFRKVLLKHRSLENFFARRVRTDKRWVEGVGVDIGQPGSNAIGKGARYTSTGMLKSN